MMKKIRYILSTLAGLAALTGLAALAACSQVVAPQNQTGGTTGRVILNVSAGPGNAPRTILPTGAPEFSRYELDFNDGTAALPTVTAAPSGLAAGQDLAPGDWTVTVRAYRNFTPTQGPNSGTETEYLAAQGVSESFTVGAGEITPVTVALTPVPIDGSAPAGIFTYTVSFPAGVTASLNFGRSAPVTLTSGRTVSVETTPGYYDLSIILTKGPLAAGTAEKVHIYSGLESKAEFTFEDADFVQTLPLPYNTWTEGDLPANGQEWYTFDATAGVPYALLIDSLYDGTGKYTGNVSVAAYLGSDGSSVIGTGYPFSRTLSVTADDTVYVYIQAYKPGTYAVRYYDHAALPPQVGPPVQATGFPTPASVITWDPLSGATGYTVSRLTPGSDTYEEIGRVTGTSYTDTTVTAGLTYRYQVKAVNGKGDGRDSAPVSVAIPSAVSLTANTWPPKASANPLPSAPGRSPR
jgi:hypothetical protein